jgi:hypothetical protein
MSEFELVGNYVQAGDAQEHIIQQREDSLPSSAACQEISTSSGNTSCFFPSGSTRFVVSPYENHKSAANLVISSLQL